MSVATLLAPNNPKRTIRYSVNPTAFVAALILAPVSVTLLTCWTIIGLFALPFGAIPYLLLGTPVLLWAVTKIEPAFWSYAILGFAVNLVCCLACAVADALNLSADADDLAIIFGFGLIFGPLYAGAFGMLYANFHPNRRILQI
ncbi:hypothetical protein [Yoonia maritima]|nr:hypothetical protein [Yoonia maritima]